MFGVTLKHADDLKLKEIIEKEYVKAFKDEREKLRHAAKEGIQKIQEENRKNFNKRRKLPKQYKLGELVAIKRTQFINQGKFKTKYLGPYKVTAIRSHDRYDVEKIGAGEGPKKTSSAADLMKPWSHPEENPELDNSYETDYAEMDQDKGDEDRENLETDEIEECEESSDTSKELKDYEEELEMNQERQDDEEDSKEYDMGISEVEVDSDVRNGRVVGPLVRPCHPESRYNLRRRRNGSGGKRYGGSKTCHCCVY